MGLRAIKVLFKFTITLFMITIGASVFAGSIWDGSVSTARYGYLPQTGLYAASNAFPQNSRVTVTNPDTGQKVDVTILERLEDNNVFLVLSAEAADLIGIEPGDIFYGNISEQYNNVTSMEQELPYNPDPDVNPSANSESFSELALIQNYIEELGVQDEVPVTTDIADPITESVEAVEIIPSEESIVGEIEEDIPLVNNIPMEEVYVSDQDNILSIPEVVIIPDEVIEEIYTIDEDIPVLIGISADVPVAVVSIDIKDVLPEIPVPESDVPVVTLLDPGVIVESENEITAIKLPELPIIGIEVVEIPEEETPFAVIMATGIVPVENEEKIDYFLPEVIEGAANDLPEHTFLAEEEPDAPAAIILSELDPEIVIPEEKIVISDTLEIPDDIAMEVEVVLEPSSLRPPVLPDVPAAVEAEDISPDIDIVEVQEPDDTDYPDLTDIAEVTNVIDTTETEESTDPPSGNYSITKVLAEDSYYLQLGAYREQYSAFDLAGRLGGTYPVTVLVSESRDNLNYKVMVGPLGQDESGVILYSFKSTGYPDAFLRKGL